MSDDYLTPDERAAMSEADGYLSRNRPYLARLQRQRRARRVRIDYMPNKDALAAIEAKRGRYYPLNTNSGIIDAILTEWAELTGINCREVTAPKSPPKSSTAPPELMDQYAPARITSEGKRPGQRVTCGARRHRDGQPCQAKSEPGKRRCRFHGGRSTGPRTDAGKARALANLRQNRKADTCPETG